MFDALDGMMLARAMQPRVRTVTKIRTDVSGYERAAESEKYRKLWKNRALSAESALENTFQAARELGQEVNDLEDALAQRDREIAALRAQLA